MCEALWKPGLKPDQLFEAVSQSLVNAFDRDALSGWGAEVYLMYVFYFLIDGYLKGRKMFILQILTEK